MRRKSRLSWFHRCEHCGQIYSDQYYGHLCRFLCDDCQAKQEALRLPLATAVADPFLALPMTHDSALRGTEIEEPHPLPIESLLRGQEQAGRMAHNRSVLRRWKKKA